MHVLFAIIAHTPLHTKESDIFSMTEKIKAQELTGGNYAIISGKVVYSRIASVIDEEEARRRAVNSPAMYPTTVEHTRIAINDAVVLFADPNNPTVEERYVQQNLYTEKRTGKTAWSIDNKGHFLPPVFQLNPETNQYEQVNPLEGELANELPVTIVLRVIKPKKPGYNPGLVIERIAVNGPIQYYTPAGTISNDVLAERGLLFAAAPVQQTSNVSPEAYDETLENQANTVPPANMQSGTQQYVQPQQQQTPQFAQPQQYAQPQAPAPQMQPQAPQFAQPQQQTPQFGQQPQAPQFVQQQPQQQAPAPQMQPQVQPQAQQPQGGAPNDQSAFQQNPAGNPTDPWG